MEVESKTSADVLIEFLRAAGNSGSVVTQLEELKNQIQMLEDLKAENQAFEELISNKIKNLKEVEHTIDLKQADLAKSEEKFFAAKTAFEAEKFALKNERATVEQMLADANNKIGEAEAKIKRLELDQANAAQMMATAIEQRRKIDEAVKAIAKLASDL